MPAADLYNLTTIEGASAALKARRISARELLDIHLGRIERFDPGIRAFVTVSEERARKDAERADQEIAAGLDRGPLHGIPVALKDVICTGGILTSGGSRAFRSFVPARDADVAGRLAAAGAVLVGKVATHELAAGLPGADSPWPAPRNPWRLDRMTGGSSSGSAAAVAAGFALGSVGTDTGGSIRSPSALCGLVGMKPTFGLVSTRGVFPHSASLDTCGPMATTVGDAALVLTSIADSVGEPMMRALSEPIAGLRVGVVRHFWENDCPVDADVAQGLDDAVRILAGLGAVVRDVTLRPLSAYYDARLCIGSAELLAAYEPLLRRNIGDFGASFLGKALPSCLFTASDYVNAQSMRGDMVREMQDTFGSVDVLLTAAHVAPAPAYGSQREMDFWSQPLFPTPFSLTGVPALVLPIAWSREKLPISMQLAAGRLNERTLLRVASNLEAARRWKDERPPLDLAGTPGYSAAGPNDLSPDADEIAAREPEAVRLSDLPLGASHLQQIAAAAPYVRAVSARLSAGMSAPPARL